jgi:hypothetical protein
MGRNGSGDKNDSFNMSSMSSTESVDSKGRPKRLPRPRLAKKILDSYNIMTGARNLQNLEKLIALKHKQMTPAEA